ncbi:hypothetical protein BKP45_10240 [Anaerobacillus alkalidiazotrophicus]|uniref:Uncharacterized protein n=1 Tax=Anaerobacillus alkalidiazotrophicus TaxID=472963 RepID=A0A1S2M6M1_9BACI|nr:hypothetical protein BKP45_10240 [Anaerobacillus alkalidiazotrophicus]
MLMDCWSKQRKRVWKCTVGGIKKDVKKLDLAGIVLVASDFINIWRTRHGIEDKRTIETK